MSLEVQGNLKKLSHELGEGNLVNYFLRVQEPGNIDPTKVQVASLNEFIEKKITINFSGQINCVACTRVIKKSFNNGYCFPCLNKLAECDICIMKPELCHYDKGTCRDNDFAAEHCNIDHSLYLSLTSAAKIGITRSYQERSRWIDQGAVKALRVLTVKRRYHAGLLEHFIAKSMPDKTNWRKMLKNEVDDIDLENNRKEVLKKIKNEIADKKFTEDLAYLLEAQEPELIQEIKYPVKEYPQKLNSFNLDSNPLAEGVLLGIKAQYLIFDNGVINIRKYAGYKVRVTVE